MKQGTMNLKAALELAKDILEDVEDAEEVCPAREDISCMVEKLRSLVVELEKPVA